MEMIHMRGWRRQQQKEAGVEVGVVMVKVVVLVV
jgi:hypothetical protein